MSKEKMPVLVGAIPAFEMMMTRLERLATRQRHLASPIKVGLKFAYKYYSKMDDTDAYVMGMCESRYYCLASCDSKTDKYLVVHPGICLMWVMKYWNEKYKGEARTTILNVVCDYLEFFSFFRTYNFTR